MADFDKEEKKQLRILADRAHVREIEMHLRGLGQMFDDWREQQVKTGDLHNAIHDFYTGPSSRLLSIYAGVQPALLVGRAVARDLLTPDEIPIGLPERLEPAIDFYRSNSDGSGGKSADSGESAC